MGKCALSCNLVLIVQTKYLKTFILNSYNEQQQKDSENNWPWVFDRLTLLRINQKGFNINLIQNKLKSHIVLIS